MASVAITISLRFLVLICYLPYLHRPGVGHHVCMGMATMGRMPTGEPYAKGSRK